MRKTMMELLVDEVDFDINVPIDGLIELLEKVRKATLIEAAKQTRHDCGIESLDPKSIEI